MEFVMEFFDTLRPWLQFLNALTGLILGIGGIVEWRKGNIAHAAMWFAAAAWAK